MNFEELLNHRRSVRLYDPEKELDTQKVRKCIELATLAPASSNMQLWEFYHITSANMLKKMERACIYQAPAATAKELVVFVTRQDLFRKRSRQILDFERDNIRRNCPPEKQERYIKNQELYYKVAMPFIYGRFFKLYGLFRKAFATTVGLFRPIVREVSECDMRVVVHKTCGLAAQTFMMAMANEGYDTCPLEGFDSRLIRKALKLPRGSEVNMVISCGVRRPDGKGIRGDRFRVPFEEVYRPI